jgi:hypothetical protein
MMLKNEIKNNKYLIDIQLLRFQIKFVYNYIMENNATTIEMLFERAEIYKQQ